MQVGFYLSCVLLVIVFTSLLLAKDESKTEIRIIPSIMTNNQNEQDKIFHFKQIISYPSTTLSAYNFIGMSGSILAPYVTGYLADTAGSMQVGFYLSCVLLVIGLLAFAFLAKDE